MSHHVRRLGFAAVGLSALMLLGPSAVRAQTVALSFTGGIFTAGPRPVTIGWSFTANEDIVVTALGYWDQTPATPLGEDHLVGLWTDGGALLGSTTVLTNSSLLSNFRYAASQPLSLSAGQTYVIGALIVSPVDNAYIGNNAMVTTAPQITFNGARIISGSAALTFPSSTAGPAGGRFGPNFQFVTAAIPEPGTSALVAASGLLSLAGVWSRRHRRCASRI